VRKYGDVQSRESELHIGSRFTKISNSLIGSLPLPHSRFQTHYVPRQRDIFQLPPPIQPKLHFTLTKRQLNLGESFMSAVNMARANKLKRSQKPTPSTIRLRRSPGSDQAEEPLQPVDELQKSRVGEFFLMHSTLIEIGKKALADCVALHEQCKPTTSTSSKYFLPTRLIDLESLERPKLIDSKAIIGEDQRYACLSHQWGKPDQDTKQAMTTTCDNLQARVDGIDFWALPERYRESILICKPLGIRYMWIDSLCIIQVCLGLPYFVLKS